MVTTLVVVGLFLAESLIPVPYVIERPGPVANTLGTVVVGDKTVHMIDVSGAETYPTSGELNLLTVSILGNPEDHPGWFDMLAAAIDPTQDIVPMEQIYPTGVTTEDRQAENKAEMTSSQDAATAAALTGLNIPFTQTLSVGEVSESGPAHGILQPGDVLVSVNGTPVSSYSTLRASIEANGAGVPATFSILRKDAPLDVSVTPVKVTEGDQSAVLIGVSVETKFVFPFSVKVRVDEIGGPSAGLMFALGITDVLTPENLADGRIISGTGTIDPSGNVGAIGGLPQKVVAAERANSELMFIPADQCADVPPNEFDKIRIVPVATLSDAVAALESLRVGAKMSALESCDVGMSSASAK
jgi:PDZ domain-containing protein